MPSEITSEGVHRISGLNRKTTTPEISSIKRTVSAVERQELPDHITANQPSSEVQDTNTSRETIERNIEHINAQVQNIQRDLQFSVDAESGRTVIRVIDSETKETIRIIPPEDVSSIAQRLNGSSGVLFNSSA